MWGKPQLPKAETEAGNDDSVKSNIGGSGILSHGGMLPRAVISHQHQQTHHQDQAPLNYFNIPPPPPPSDRSFYPSMDPQRMGAVNSNNQETSNSGAPGDTSQQQNQQQSQYGPPRGPPAYGYGPGPQYQQPQYHPSYSQPNGAPGTYPYPPYHSGPPMPPPQHFYRPQF